jgi:hypothetical protein
VTPTPILRDHQFGKLIQKLSNAGQHQQSHQTKKNGAPRRYAVFLDAIGISQRLKLHHGVGLVRLVVPKIPTVKVSE